MKIRHSLFGTSPLSLLASGRQTLTLLVLLASLSAIGCTTAAPSFNSDPSAKLCRTLLQATPKGRSAVRESAEPAQEISCQPAIEKLQNRRSTLRNLVFEGGGVKGTAYVGALQVLEEQGILQGIERVAGTSAGAITALLVSLGYEVDEIRQIVLGSLDFARLEDGNGIYRNSKRLVSNYGWYRGDYLLCFVEELITQRLGSPNATFADLEARSRQDARYRRLWVVGTDVSTNRSRAFSAETHPDLPIAEAIRISMSIPFFFAARQLEEDGQEGIYVDGAVLRSYPISIFDVDGQANNETLGFHLGAGPIEHQKVDNIVEFTGQLFKSLVDVQLDALCRSPEDVARTVFIDCSSIESTNFQISDQQQCNLIHTGAKATADYLAQPTVDGACPELLTDYLHALGLR